VGGAGGGGGATIWWLKEALCVVEEDNNKKEARDVRLIIAQISLWNAATRFKGGNGAGNASSTVQRWCDDGAATMQAEWDDAQWLDSRRRRRREDATTMKWFGVF